jgi:hypothetical protein
MVVATLTLPVMVALITQVRGNTRLRRPAQRLLLLLLLLLLLRMLRMLLI